MFDLLSQLLMKATIHWIRMTENAYYIGDSLSNIDGFTNTLIDASLVSLFNNTQTE